MGVRGGERGVRGVWEGCERGGERGVRGVVRGV